MEKRNPRDGRPLNSGAPRPPYRPGQGQSSRFGPRTPGGAGGPGASGSAPYRPQNARPQNSGGRFSREQEDEADALAREDTERGRSTSGREAFSGPRHRDADGERDAYRERARPRFAVGDNDRNPGGARESDDKPRYGKPGGRFSGGEGGNKFGGGPGGNSGGYQNGGYNRDFGPRKPRPAAPSKEEIIFGTRPVQEALLAGRALERVFVQRGLKSPLGAEVLEAAKNLHVPVQEVPLEKLNSLTQKQHQGVVAFLPVLEYAPLDEIVRKAFESGRTPLIVLLDRVTDVRNFGSIARAAECLGADALLIPTRGAAQINGDAVKTSAGALNRLPVCREPNLKESLTYLRAAGLRVVSCTEKADAEIGQANSPDLSGPLVLILGSEEDGISPEYLRLSDEQVKIPLLGHINSLNVSVAAGVMLYEVQRQRRS